LTVLGISGSLRRDSYNTKLVRAVGELFDATDADFVPYEALKAVPPYDEDDDVEPALEAVSRLRAAVAGADAIVIATPEYNSSIPGHLKNALDWISRPIATNVMRNKPVAVIGASTGAFGAVWSQAELRNVSRAIGARVLDVEVAVGHAHTRFDEGGGLIDDAIREQLHALVDEVVTAVSERVIAVAA